MQATSGKYHVEYFQPQNLGMKKGYPMRRVAQLEEASCKNSEKRPKKDELMVVVCPRYMY